MMKMYDITITFTISEKHYERFDRNINRAMDLLIPYGSDYNVEELDHYEDEE